MPGFFERKSTLTNGGIFNKYMADRAGFLSPLTPHHGQILKKLFFKFLTERLPLLDNSRCFFHLLGGGLRRRIHLVDNHRRHTLVVGPLMQTEGCAGPKGRSVRRPSSVRPPTRARMKQPSRARASALIRGRRSVGRAEVGPSE